MDLTNIKIGENININGVTLVLTGVATNINQKDATIILKGDVINSEEKVNNSDSMEGYRLLKVGEVTQEGDEYLCGSFWFPLEDTGEKIGRFDRC